MLREWNGEAGVDEAGETVSVFVICVAVSCIILFLFFYSI